VHDALLNWYSAAGRHDLPWRQTRDPWAVLVSELMLQQTQVPRVLPKYGEFMRRFPTAAACAAAPVGEVVRAWAGLGYNRRAVNLHRAAGMVAAGFPDTLEGLLALPGIGPYTARAVLAFAYERPVCPLDVNTARPLARAFGVDGQPAADALVPDAPAPAPAPPAPLPVLGTFSAIYGRKGAQKASAASAASARAWVWNQALMDLGALVCTRRSPSCEVCPWKDVCGWRLGGGPDPAAPAGRQSRFAGSDRQGSGRLVDALRSGPVPVAAVAEVMGWPDDADRAARVAATLVADGLAEVLADGSFTLPD